MNRHIRYEATFPTEQEGLVAKFPFRRTYIVHTENEPFLCTDGEYRLDINFYSLFDVIKKYPTAYRWKLTTIENGKILEECLIYIPRTGSRREANIRSGHILREVPEIRQISIAENDTYERTYTLEYEIESEIYERRKD